MEFTLGLRHRVPITYPSMAERLRRLGSIGLWLMVGAPLRGVRSHRRVDDESDLSEDPTTPSLDLKRTRRRRAPT
jgi:hypothetical protein